MPLITGALDRARAEKPKPSTQDSSTQTHLTWTQVVSLEQKVKKFHQNWKASLTESQIKEKINKLLSFRLSVLQQKISNLASEEKFMDDNEDSLNKEINKLVNLSLTTSPKDFEANLQPLEKIFAQPKYQESHKTIEQQWFTEQLTKLSKIKSLVYFRQLLSSKRELEIASLQKQLAENEKQWKATQNQIQVDQKRLYAQAEEEREALIQSHQKSLKQRDQQIATLQKTIESLKITAGATQTNLEKKVNELEGINQTQKDTIKKQNQLIFNLTLHLFDKDQEINRQQEKIANLELTQQSLEAVRDSLQEQLKKGSGQQEELQREIKRKNAEIYDLEEKVKQAEKDLITLRQEKQAKEDELNQTIFTLKQEIQTLKNLSEKDRASLNNEVNHLKQELLTAREQINSLKDQTERVAELEKKIKTNAAQSLEAEESFKKQIQVHISQQASQKRKIEDLESQVDQSVITDEGEKQFFNEVFGLADQFTNLFTSIVDPSGSAEPVKWQEFQQWYTNKFKNLPKGGDDLPTGFLPNPRWKYPRVWLQTSHWLANLHQAIDILRGIGQVIQQQKARENKLKKEIRQLKTTAEQSNLGGQQLQNQIVSLQQTIEQHETTIKELRAIILELEDKLRQKDSTYEALQRNHRQAQEQLQQRISDLENQAIQDRNTIASLENSLQSLQNRFRDTEDLLNTANQEREAMAVERERLFNEKNALADKISDLEREAEERERRIKLLNDKEIEHEDSLRSLRELLAAAEIRLQEGELTSEERTILGEIRVLLQEINLARVGNVDDNLTRIQNHNQSIVRLFMANPDKYRHLGGLLSTHFTPQAVFVKNIMDLIKELEETAGGLEAHRREAAEKSEECMRLIAEKGRMMKVLGIHRRNVAWINTGNIDFTQGVNQEEFFRTELTDLKMFHQNFTVASRVIPEVPINLNKETGYISIGGSHVDNQNIEINVDMLKGNDNDNNYDTNLFIKGGGLWTDETQFGGDGKNYRHPEYITPYEAGEKIKGAFYYAENQRSDFRFPPGNFHKSSIGQKRVNIERKLTITLRKEAGIPIIYTTSNSPYSFNHYNSRRLFFGIDKGSCIFSPIYPINKDKPVVQYFDIVTSQEYFQLFRQNGTFKITIHTPLYPTSAYQIIEGSKVGDWVSQQVGMAPYQGLMQIHGIVSLRKMDHFKKWGFYYNNNPSYQFFTDTIDSNEPPYVWNVSNTASGSQAGKGGEGEDVWAYEISSQAMKTSGMQPEDWKVIKDLIKSKKFLSIYYEEYEIYSSTSNPSAKCVRINSWFIIT